MTTAPSGLSSSLAILAISFEVATPDRCGESTGDVVHVRLELGGDQVETGRGQVELVRGRGQVDERLVQGQRLDQRVTARAASA